jgi:hypothetical protein
MLPPYIPPNFQVVIRDRAFRSVLLEGPALTEHFGAALQLCDDLVAAGNVPCGASTSAEVGELYRKKVLMATRMSCAEFRKLYKQWTEARSLLYWLGSPHFRRVAARTIMRALDRQGDVCPDGFEGVDDAECPADLRAWWTTNMAEVQEEDVRLLYRL